VNPSGEEPAATADLERCAQEPIHIPGSIQPHGVVVSARPDTLAIAQCSSNAPFIWGEPAAALLGRPVDSLLDRGDAAQLRDALLAPVPPPTLSVSIRGQSFDVSAHRHQGTLIVEFEPGTMAPSDIDRRLAESLAALQRVDSLPDLAQTAARVVRQLTGFERVMLYVFHADQHGEVIAENRADEVESYLGLHYPASDIPHQARELYRANWLRLIPDARYEPAELVPVLRPDTGQPLDLSYIGLRSVSPIHREYLANMGVRASMSISLIVKDALWGLIACHHRSPHHVPQRVRGMCELIARLVSLQIAALQEVADRRQRADRKAPLQTICDALVKGSDVMASLTKSGDTLLDLTGAGGAAVVVDGECTRTMGHVPPLARITAMARWLGARDSFETYHSNALGEEFPSDAALSDVASGLLAIALPRPGSNLVLWFRPELVHTLSWAGDPSKPVLQGERLRPRTSFAAWKATVRGHAAPWSAVDIQMAAELRRSLIEYDLAHQVARERAAVELRDELVAVVAHDLRNPLGVIRMQLGLLNFGTADKDPPRMRAALERMQRSVDRMVRLIDDLLDLSKIEGGRLRLTLRDQEVDVLLQDALAIMMPLAQRKAVQILAPGAPGLRVRVDAERVFQVLSNILGNAIKFTPEGGRIGIVASRESHEVQVKISDTGPGIPPEDLPHLFDRYWRAPQSGGKGVGLGLYIAKGIVEAHGGRIWADCAPGAGTTIGFTLPAAR
jgi:two-component system, chemotaxis family, sensor kinase Cph1